MSVLLQRVAACKMCCGGLKHVLCVGNNCVNHCNKAVLVHDVKHILGRCHMETLCVLVVSGLKSMSLNSYITGHCTQPAYLTDCV